MECSIFTTPRLSIRKLKPSDLSEYHKMVSNPKVMLHVKAPLNYEESKAELLKFISYYSAKIFYNIWAVTRVEDEYLIGICGVYKNQNEENEIAYRLLESYWGNGFGKEIATYLISYCTNTLHLSELVAYAYSENIGSIKILENKMNFVSEFQSPKTGVFEKKFVLNTK